MTRHNILFAVTICVFAVSTFAVVQYFRSARGHTTPVPYDEEGRRSLRIGDTVCLPPTSGSPKPALLFLLSRTCPYSQAMIPVVQMAQELANEKNLEITIVIDSIANLDDAWSRALVLPTVRTFVGTRVEVGYSATPVIAMLDKDRRIKAHKVGFLPSEDGKEVLANVAAATLPYSAEVNDVRRAELELDVSLGDSTQLVSLQKHISSTALSASTIYALGKVMLVADLTLRAPYELDVSQPVVLDCSDVSGFDCEVSTYSLAHLGYTLLYTIDGWDGKILANSCLE
jgi:hypothetical protein